VAAFLKLAKNFVDINGMAQNSGHTRLTYATSLGDITMMTLLINSGALVTTKNSQGNFPLDCALELARSKDPLSQQKALDAVLFLNSIAASIISQVQNAKQNNNSEPHSTNSNSFFATKNTQTQSNDIKSEEKSFSQN
jgi:ankyrin repeat protein